MQPDPDRPEVVKCADMLAPEGYGEVIGGSERIHDFDLLEERMCEHDLSEEAYGWYLDLRRYGSVPPFRVRTWDRKSCGMDYRKRTRQRDDSFPRLLNRIYP